MSFGSDHGEVRLYRSRSAAGIKLIVLCLLCLVLMFLDTQWKGFAPVRSVLGLIEYPFQLVAQVPTSVYHWGSNWIGAADRVSEQEQSLQSKQIELTQLSTRAQQLQAENAQLRRLLGIKNTVNYPSIAAEILYTSPDPYVQTFVLDKGSKAGVRAGMPVIGEGGLVGQVRRVTRYTAEVALITNVEVNIPAVVLRNGLRVITFGSGQSGRLDIRFLPSNADIKPGDILVTSGIGGVYPPGIALAKVESTHRGANGFDQAMASPTAQPDRFRHFLILLTPISTQPMEDVRSLKAPVQKAPSKRGQWGGSR